MYPTHDVMAGSLEHSRKLQEEGTGTSSSPAQSRQPQPLLQSTQHLPSNSLALQYMQEQQHQAQQAHALAQAQQHQLQQQQQHSANLAAYAAQAQGTGIQHMTTGSLLLPDLLPHSGGLFSAALDPTGSLSHIDLGMLSSTPFHASSSHPVSMFQHPMSTFRSDHFAPKEEPSSSSVDHQLVSGNVSTGSLRGSPTMTAEGGAVHPEVGDIIGDNSMTHEKIISYFKQYALSVGFSMTRNFDNPDSAGRYRRVRVSCKQGGLPRKTTKHENPALQRERTSQKVGCPFEVTVWRTKQRPGGVQSTDEQWVITNVKGLSHGPCALLGGTCHPLSNSHDGVHKDVQIKIKAQLKKNAQVAQHALGGSPATFGQSLDMPTLTRFLAEATSALSSSFSGDVAMLIIELASSVKRVSDSLAAAGMFGGQIGSSSSGEEFTAFANSVMKAAALSTGHVQCISSAADKNPSFSSWGTGHLSMVLDPLHGAGTIDAAVPSGTIFGICCTLETHTSPETSAQERGAGRECLQPGSNLIVAGYALYSSVTMLVLTLGSGTHGFTLDRRSGDFVMTHKDMAIPARGQTYAVNELCYGEWPPGLQLYIQAIVQGNGETKHPYSARCTFSLVADFHRTLIHGGILLNPGNRLRLLQAANPLCMLMEQAGGQATNGTKRVLEVNPGQLDELSPVFFGSQDDMVELTSFLSSGTSGRQAM